MYFRISIVLYTLVERIELDIKKSSGLIMHPTALPSKYGIGDFGNTSKEFIDFLEETSTNIWQVLPLGLTSLDEFSPYSSPSSILGNRYLIDIEQLDGFDKKNYNVENFSKEYVEYKKVYEAFRTLANFLFILVPCSSARRASTKILPLCSSTIIFFLAAISN